MAEGGATPGVPPGESGVASTASTRSTDTTARGSSSKKKPRIRIGNARIENSDAACTRSPGVTAPESILHAPTTNSTIVPRFGSRSRTGSNDARRPPTTSRCDRRRSEAKANRSDSACSMPSVLTTSAPSKLSCATADTSPSRCWTNADGTSARRAYTLLSSVSIGNSPSAITVNAQSTSMRLTRANTTSAITPMLKGSGLITIVVPETSASAWASSSPVGRLW